MTAGQLREELLRFDQTRTIYVATGHEVGQWGELQSLFLNKLNGWVVLTDVTLEAAKFRADHKHYAAPGAGGAPADV